jgi:hypothetical protein
MKIVKLVLAVFTVVGTISATPAFAGVVSCPGNPVFGNALLDRQLVSQDGEIQAQVRVRIIDYKCDVPVTVVETKVVLLDKNGVALPFLPEFFRPLSLKLVDAQGNVLKVREVDAPSRIETSAFRGLSLLINLDGFDEQSVKLQ